MRLGTRLDPRAEERLRRVSSSSGDEFVSRLTEGPVRTESRANARMLINAEAKRRSARNSVRASRPQSTSAAAVLG